MNFTNKIHMGRYMSQINRNNNKIIKKRNGIR